MPHTRRMLIVEDDATQRELFQRIVERFFPAARVTTTSTGYEMLTAYQHLRPRLIIVDNRLPDMLGTALIAHLRATGDTTPILLVTACLPSEDLSTDPYTVSLQKPVPIPDLVATLTALLQVRGTACGEPAGCTCIIGHWCQQQCTRTITQKPQRLRS